MNNFLISALVLVIFNGACDSPIDVRRTEKSSNETVDSFALITDAENGLPACTAQRNGVLVYVKNLNSFKSCDGSGWTEVSIKGDKGEAGSVGGHVVGTAANNILRLDSDGKLPALDGSALTNVSISLTPILITANQSDTREIAADGQRLYLLDGTTTLTLPTTVKAGNTITFKNVGAGIVYLDPAGSVLEGSAALFPIAPGAVAGITSDGSAWYLTQWQGGVGRCGDTAFNNCYDTDKAKQFLNAGYAVTQSGKLLEAYVASPGSQIWKEKNGSRLLQANGLDGWQKTLNANGKGHTSTDFTARELIGGRVCPLNVYLDDANKFSIGRCLYYDLGNTPQMLDQDGTDGILGLVGWNTYHGGVAKWFVGNIMTCGNRGMRLPTLFEASVNYPSVTPGDVDGHPQFAGDRGVPSYNGYTWTATAKTNGVTWYAIWSDGNHNVSFGYNNAVRPLRCVLP